jgi:hypothetical protein
MDTGSKTEQTICKEGDAGQNSSRVAPANCLALLLPLLHRLVEERAGERRNFTSVTKPLSPALSPHAGRERPRGESISCENRNMNEVNNKKQKIWR